MKSGGGKLTPPFAWAGGKRLIADEVWKRLGDVQSYVEPFAGGAAVLLARPHPKARELINDSDGFVTNFWRALKHEPDTVAFYVSDFVNEHDLQARHGWLVNRAKRLAWALEDPDFYDPKAAGWWAWAQSCWLGGAFASGKGPWKSDGAHITRQVLKDGSGFTRRVPTGGGGFTRKVPTDGSGFTRKVPTDGSGFTRFEHAKQWCTELAARLQNTTVYCGDWKRCLGTRLKYKSVGIFLDPPYEGTEAIYAAANNVAGDVWKWCAAHGTQRHLRIALCGYDIESPGEGWTALRWKASIGFRSSAGIKKNGASNQREIIWFSPGCV